MTNFSFGLGDKVICTSSGARGEVVEMCINSSGATFGVAIKGKVMPPVVLWFTADDLIATSS